MGCAYGCLPKFAKPAMKTTGNASITLLQGHESMAKIFLLAMFGHPYAQHVVCAILAMSVRMQ